MFHCEVNKMNRFLIGVLIAAPLALAACEEVGVQREQTVIGGPAEPQPVVIPGSSTATGSTVVVNPTTVISTDLAALAGSYDTGPLECRNAASPSRVTITDQGLNTGAETCGLTQTAREGSALRLNLSCVAGQTRTDRITYVTPAAQGIQIRDSGRGDRNLLRCDS